MDVLRQDLRYALRSYRRSPGFTAVALATLALAIGATVAVFAMVHAVVWRALPFDDPDRLVLVYEARTATRAPAWGSLPNFTDWRDESRSFSGMAAYTDTTFNLTGSGEPERLNATQMSSTLLAVLGAKPHLGRAFLAEEDRPGAAPVAILSHALWQRRFAGDRAIVGRMLSLNSRAYTVVGVMDRGFQYPIQSDPIDIYTPIEQDDFAQMRLRDGRLVHVAARLRPGVARRAAQTEMEGIAARLERQYPESNAGWGVLVAGMQEEVAGSSRNALLMLFVAVTLVLLIACANLANLFLVRTAARRREIAVRAALGAGRARLVRQLLTESLLVSAAGGVAGVLAFGWMRAGILAAAPAAMPRLQETGLDPATVAFGVAVSALTGLFMALGSAATALGVSEAQASGDGRSAGAGAARNRVRTTLVAAQIALAVVLLTGAALLTKSLVRVLSVSPGIEVSEVLTLGLEVPGTTYATPARRAQFYDEVVARLSSVPGVDAAAAAFPLPFGSPVAFPFSIDGRPEPARRTGAYYRTVTPDYFRTLELPLIRGRVFSPMDHAGAPAIVVINQSMAARFWPGATPIGHRITIVDRNAGDRATSREIVGIVGDVRHQGLDRPTGPEMYVPHAQAPSLWMGVLVRTARPSIVVPRMAPEIHAVDPVIPVGSPQSMEARLARSLSPRRFTVMLLGAFAGVALLLTALGVWGVTSYTVTQRRPELAIRMALGAQRRDVLLMILRGTAAVAMAGTAVGAAAAYTLSGLISTLLFDVQPFDPVTFAGVAGTLVLLALLAALGPARSATRVDPIAALRGE